MSFLHCWSCHILGPFCVPRCCSIFSSFWIKENLKGAAKSAVGLQEMQPTWVEKVRMGEKLKQQKLNSHLPCLFTDGIYIYYIYIYYILYIYYNYIIYRIDNTTGTCGYNCWVNWWTKSHLPSFCKQISVARQCKRNDEVLLNEQLSWDSWICFVAERILPSSKHTW